MIVPKSVSSAPTGTKTRSQSHRVGIWLIGAYGGVASTAALGLAAWARGLTDTTSLVTALPLFEKLHLDAPQQFVVGGHEIRQGGFRQTVAELHQRSNIFDRDLMEACAPDLEQWEANVRPGSILQVGGTISTLADWKGLPTDSTAQQSIDRIQADLRAFQKKHHLDQVVVINVSSTEPLFELGPVHARLESLVPALKTEAGILPASSLYAYAALDLGFAYVNFTPSLGASIPALIELAKQRKTVIAGKDGKTGETLMKSVLAPMFSHRNLQILSWVGHNIFGNRDGIVLNDPANKASKVKTKDQVISSIVGYKPQTLVTIEYIESLDDWKTAWNHIHYRGFLGTKMMLQFTWQGCDSILAAPLVLDLARLALLGQRRGDIGVLKHLACFFKNPMDVSEHDFFKEFALLEQYVEQSSH